MTRYDSLDEAEKDVYLQALEQNIYHKQTKCAVLFTAVQEPVQCV